MKSSAKKIALCVLLSSTVLYSSDSTLSLTLNKGHTKSTVPTKESKADTYTGTLVYTKALFTHWRVSGILAYAGVDKTTTLNVQNDMDITTFGLAGSRNLGNGLFLNLAGIYSNIGIDSTDINSPINSYNANGSSYAASIGLLKIVPTSKKSYASLSAKITATKNKTDDYTIGLLPINSNTVNKTYLSLKAKHAWIFPEFTPNINLQYNIANKEFNTNSGDKSYYRVGTGINKKLGKDLSFSLNYSQTLNRKYINSNKISASISKKF